VRSRSPPLKVEGEEALLGMEGGGEDGDARMEEERLDKRAPGERQKQRADR
jgi:hypothetical protein